MLSGLLLTLGGTARSFAEILATVPASEGESCSHPFGKFCTNVIYVTVTVSGGSGDYSYQWEFTDNPFNFSMASSQAQTVSVSKTGQDELQNCVIRCLVTDNETGNSGYSNTCTVVAAFGDLS